MHVFYPTYITFIQTSIYLVIVTLIYIMNTQNHKYSNFTNEFSLLFRLVP
jgi:hypothetical protein